MLGAHLPQLLSQLALVLGLNLRQLGAHAQLLRVHLKVPPHLCTRAKASASAHSPFTYLAFSLRIHSPKNGILLLYYC